MKSSHRLTIVLLAALIALAGAGMSASATDNSDDIVDGKTMKHAIKLMDSIIALDTHCDFPEVRYFHPEKNYSIDEENSRCQVSIQKMKKGHMSAQYLATWINPTKDMKDPDYLASAPSVLWDFIEKTEAHIAEHSDKCGIARSKEDILALKKEGKIAFLYGLENAFWLGTDLKNLEKLKEYGYTYVTLCHWGDNQICHSCDKSENPALGLTLYGRQFVAEMNRLGMVIDLSHSSYGTWNDVLELSKSPVMFSHSGAAGVFKHQRNVDDATLKKLAANGGVVQVIVLPSFMASENKDKVGVKDMVDHIDHIVKVAGIDHVGIGLDFDGGGGGVGIRGADDALNITVELIRRGYSDEEIAKIWGGNYLRVLTEAQELAE